MVVLRYTSALTEGVRVDVGDSVVLAVVFVIITCSSNCDGDNTAVVAGSVMGIHRSASWECVVGVSRVGMGWLIG